MTVDFRRIANRNRHDPLAGTWIGLLPEQVAGIGVLHREAAHLPVAHSLENVRLGLTCLIRRALRERRARTQQKASRNARQGQLHDHSLQNQEWRLASAPFQADMEALKPWKEKGTETGLPSRPANRTAASSVLLSELASASSNGTVAMQPTLLQVRYWMTFTGSLPMRMPMPASSATPYGRVKPMICLPSLSVVMVARASTEPLGWLRSTRSVESSQAASLVSAEGQATRQSS